ncbi:MAG: histidine phosphatase family protein [Gemmatimonadota bacterium]
MRGRMKAGLILGLAGLGVTTSGCEPGREGRAYAAGGEADGQPLTGVEVTFIAEDGSGVHRATTGADGTYALPLLPGGYRVVATHPDRTDWSGRTVVEGSRTERLDLPLPAPASTTVFVVRHAEKIHPDSNGVEVPLSAEGAARAEALAHVLADAGVTAVYSTATTRTRATAGPLADRWGLAPTDYGNPAELAGALQHRNAGDAVLVSGHSNTVGPTVAALGAAVDPSTIGDYDNLYVVTLTPEGASAVNLQYGADTGPDERKTAVVVPTVLLVETAGPDPARTARIAHALAKSGVDDLWATNGDNPLVELATALETQVRPFDPATDAQEWLAARPVGVTTLAAGPEVVTRILEAAGVPDPGGSAGARTIVLTRSSAGAVARALAF